MEWFTLGIGTLSIVIVARLCMANVLVLFGHIKLQHGFSAGAEELETYWLHNVNEQLYADMQALGFRPLGIYWEKLPFTRCFHEYVFVKPGENCYGMLYPEDQILPCRASFLTVFPSGGAVFTKNYSGGLEVRAPDFVAEGGAQLNEQTPPPAPPEPPAAPPWLSSILSIVVPLVIAAGMSVAGEFSWKVAIVPLIGLVYAGVTFLSRPTPAPAPVPAPSQELEVRIPLHEVLDRHHEHVARLVAEGHVLPASHDTEAFLESERRYYEHPVVQREFRTAMGLLLGLKLIALFVPTGIAGLITGFNHPTPWLVLLFGGIVGLFLRYGCSSATVIRMFAGRGAPADPES